VIVSLGLTMIQLLTRRTALVVSGSVFAAAAVLIPAHYAAVEASAARQVRSRSVPFGHAVAPVPGRTATRHRATPGWRVEFRMPAAEPSRLLASVAAVNGTLAWATGATAPQRARKYQPIIVRWNGTAWLPVPLPAPIARHWQQGFPFSVVGAASGADVWAFSEALGRWLHWDGRRWSTGQLPDNVPYSPLVVSSAKVFSPDNVWVFGGHLTGGVNNRTVGPPYVAHFNGRRWQVRSAPRGRDAISAVSVLSSTDIWAVLGRLPLVSSHARVTRGNAVWHWNGKRWTEVPLPGQFTGDADLTSVLASSARDVWIGGGIANGRGAGLTEAVAHWNGSAWTVTMLPAWISPVRYELTSMVPDGSGGIWAVGTNEALTRSRLWHLHTGRWTGPQWLRPCRHACLLLGLAQVPGTTSVWAAGAVVRGSNGDGIMALYGRSRA
jgi:hypothetical protein